MTTQQVSRRDFLRQASATGTGLVVAFHLSQGAAGKEAMAGDFEAGEVSQTSGKAVSISAQGAHAPFEPNAWIRVFPSGTVVFALDKVEMGQGTLTSHATMVAEELEVDPAALEVVFAGGVGGDYRNPALGVQLTGGSTSVPTGWNTLRTAAATAREMLKAAAAKEWNVPASEIQARSGTLSHVASKREASYGTFAQAASKERVSNVKLKPASEFKLLGRSVPRLDIRTKIKGTATFGIDVNMPGLLHAYIVRSPTLLGSPKSFDDSAVRTLPGVQGVVRLPNGVAVVATHWYQAKKAASALQVEWEPGPLSQMSSDSLFASMREMAKTDGKQAKDVGNAEDALSKATTVLEATYETPYLAHATMEPQNCTAFVKPDSCEVWAPTQGPQQAREVAARITGLPHSKITVHQTFLGGGFGRRIAQDYVEEAVRVSQSLGRPVQVIWSREDDTRNDVYRPCAVTSLRAGLAADGTLVAWKAHVVSQSIVATIVPEFLSSMLPTWTPRFLKNAGGSAASQLLKVMVDDTAVEGAATLPYDIPNLRVEFTRYDPGVPVGFWRSVGHSFNVFVSESFTDECAYAAKKDPLAFRRELLAKKPRLRAVLELAAAKAEWDKPLPEGVFRGIAASESFASFVAHVVEASVVKNVIVVKRVVSAVDCGFVVNPDIVVAQVEGSVVFALSAALKQRITLENGRVVQGNFHDYECLRMMECPRMEVHLVPSAEEPTGIGEPAVPPLAPALAQAVFMATGKRLRSLPLSLV